jgi:antitoxin component YwqK of YwqJK toxin-antitoxin module
MECKAITNAGTQCSRIAETGSKYCWQHRNYDAKTQYFQNTDLLQNTLLSYFSTEETLKSINKQFREFNYEKYNTHLQPHGLKITYYPNTETIDEKITYVNGKRNGLYESWYDNGKLEEKVNYKNDKMDGLYESWYDNGILQERSNYKNGKYDGVRKRYIGHGKYQTLNYKKGKHVY